VLDFTELQDYAADQCWMHIVSCRFTDRRRAMGSTRYGTLLPMGAEVPQNIDNRDSGGVKVRDPR